MFLDHLCYQLLSYVIYIPTISIPSSSNLRFPSVVGLGCSCVGCPCGWCGGRFATTTRWRWWHPRHHRGLWLGHGHTAVDVEFLKHSTYGWTARMEMSCSEKIDGIQARWEREPTASTQLGRFFWLVFFLQFLPTIGWFKDVQKQA